MKNYTEIGKTLLWNSAPMSINPSVSDQGNNAAVSPLEAIVLVVTHGSKFKAPESVSNYAVIANEKPDTPEKIKSLDPSIKYVVELPYTDWAPPAHGYNGNIYFVNRIYSELKHIGMITSGDDPAEVVQVLLATEEYIPVRCRDGIAAKAPTDPVYKPNMVYPGLAPRSAARPIADMPSIESMPLLPARAEPIGVGKLAAVAIATEINWSPT